MAMRLAPALRTVLVAMLTAAIPAGAIAAPFVTGGGGEGIVLAAPPGFADTGLLASPRPQELAESLTSASNPILVFAMTDADLRRYLAVATPKGLEHERVSEPQFRNFVSDSLCELGAPAASTETDFHKLLEAQPVGRASLLAELKKEPNLVSIVQGERLPSEGGLFNPKPIYILATTTLSLQRDKALQLAVYSGYGSPEDVGWITTVTSLWIEELQRLNR